VSFTALNISSINSYGYSPHPLAQYLSWIEAILTASPSGTKPFIISITSSDSDTLYTIITAIQSLRARLNDPSHSRIAVELNTSCPNIPNSPPTGYTFSSLVPLLSTLQKESTIDPTLTVGLKLPPFVYHAQFLAVLDGIKQLCAAAPKCPFAFFTCTNTLGNTLVFAEQSSSPQSEDFAVPTALGGSAGDTIHALSLGNVYTFTSLLRQPEYEALKDIVIIGVGGVTSKEAVARMRRAGADVVGSATLFGKEGVGAFETLSRA